MKRPSLKVETGAMVLGLEFEKEEDRPPLVAKRVRYAKNGVERIARATKEVSLAAGVFETPKLLELSGIGDPDILGKYDIEVLYDNPAIGES